MSGMGDPNLNLDNPPRQISPLIGVLCIDLAQKLRMSFGDRHKSYIASSYVKYLESAGARVVPIWINKPRSYYEDIMSKINGILLPGGAVFIGRQSLDMPDISNDCVDSSRIIYQIAVEKNKAGEHFPLWGTCLGFQLMLLHSAGGKNPRQECEKMNFSLPYDFVPGFMESEMFKSLNDKMRITMTKDPAGYHNHRFIITRDKLTDAGAFEQWKILATNKTMTGTEFISIVEHKHYPFFGCQTHPERMAFEFTGGNDMCYHTPNVIAIGQYLANFFVENCRQNTNKFISYSEGLRHTIWNFPVTFTGKGGGHWMQCYLFEPDVDYPKALFY